MTLQGKIKQAALIFGDSTELSLIAVNKKYFDDSSLKNQILELDKENKKLFKYYRAHVSMCQENAKLRDRIKELEK